jgi:HPP family
MSNAGTSRNEFVIAPVCEGALILAVSAAGWLTHSPLAFTSLGPTAFELIETPNRPSAKPYNVIVGHLIGVVAGFAALALTRAWFAPSVSSGSVALPRVWAAAISALLTVLFTLLVNAQQPAALSTTLLVSLGTLQRWQDGFFIMGAVVLLVLLGEPLRRWRSEQKAEQ